MLTSVMSLQQQTSEYSVVPARINYNLGLLYAGKTSYDVGPCLCTKECIFCVRGNLYYAIGKVIITSSSSHEFLALSGNYKRFGGLPKYKAEIYISFHSVRH